MGGEPGGVGGGWGGGIWGGRGRGNLKGGGIHLCLPHPALGIVFGRAEEKPPAFVNVLFN